MFACLIVCLLLRLLIVSDSEMERAYVSSRQKTRLTRDVNITLNVLYYERFEGEISENKVVHGHTAAVLCFQLEISPKNGAGNLKYYK